MQIHHFRCFCQNGPVLAGDKNPNLLFLAFLVFLPFFLFKEFLAILSVFPFFPKDFRGSAGRRNLCLFGGFPCCFPKGTGKEDQGTLFTKNTARATPRKALRVMDVCAEKHGRQHPKNVCYMRPRDGEKLFSGVNKTLKRPGANRPPEFVPESPLQKGVFGSRIFSKEL